MMKFSVKMRLVITAAMLCAALAAPGWAAMSDKEFLRLCVNGTPDQIKAALNDGANIYAEDRVGETALNRIFRSQQSHFFKEM